MITLLTRLTFCFALFYSVNSAAYNEAMCILIKQEIQQNSGDKTSRKYRNAIRDYNNNCNKPKQAQTYPKPPIETAPVITPVQSQVVEPTLNTPQNPATLQMPLPVSIENEQQQNTIEQPNINNEVIINAEPQAKSVIDQQSTQPLKSSVPVKVKTPANITAPVAKPAPVIVPVPIDQSSLLLPSLLFVIVILIAVMVLIRLRRTKQSKAEIIAPVVTETQVLKSQKIAPPLNVTTKDAPTKQTPINAPEIIDENKTIKSNQPQLKANKTQKINTDHNNIDEVLPTTLAQTNEATFTEIKPKSEPNYTEFAAAAKTTEAQVNKANRFTEPQVQELDPHAQPIKKQPKQTTQSSATVHSNTLINNEIKPVIASPEPLKPSETTDDLHTPKKVATPEFTNFSSAHNFKEPEIRTFDPNAPLPGEKVMPKAAPRPINAEHETTKSAAEKKETVNKASSNPFANLSLDESWDPNSAEKPTIEEKKRAPKSQALIDAEERAKKMQTKE
ncbi:hypothetical protein [Pseudoalteromonas fuliginea]|uniref:Cell wall anchor protein n=1 Tax=Pseudoalteromonas fuliginea TaxID=1872678 RepID=A0ABD3Y8A0_9GAMM|nr:hypothetical protein [Pseudoalteromonas fuliginea]KDC50697.1 cell wall anchor protein [Pseudoalteromonas fuliginea]KJZ28929.1 cell wall anchor protein [Pseudoalteromonas fuliginea]